MVGREAGNYTDVFGGDYWGGEVVWRTEGTVGLKGGHVLATEARKGTEKKEKVVVSEGLHPSQGYGALAGLGSGGTGTSEKSWAGW